VTTKAVGAISSDAAQRAVSSSGGVFSLLAEAILQQGGVVFGAAFAEDYRSVHHIAIESSRELWRLQGSKYLQSSMGRSYCQAKAFLQQGRTVLFTGTPCQISGLYAFLGKRYEQLYTQSVICHGVPSPQIWEAYLQYRQQQAGAPVQSVSFREKTPSWSHYCLKVDFADGQYYRRGVTKDIYMKCFLRDYILRPSCYRCQFKADGDISDLSLADFWGVRHIASEMNDDRGTSLVLIRTEKGQRLFDLCKACLKVCEVDYRKAVFENPAILRPAKMPGKRKRFMAALRERSVPQVLADYSRDTVVTKAVSRLRRCYIKLRRMLSK
jgi:coenzyme F420-reducing hydrogenase beta subunit